MTPFAELPQAGLYVLRKLVDRAQYTINYELILTMRLQRLFLRRNPSQNMVPLSECAIFLKSIHMRPCHYLSVSETFVYENGPLKEE